MVVWASHWSSSCTEAPALRDEFQPLEQRLRHVARFSREAFGAARPREADERVDQRRAYALPTGGRIDVEHIELIRAFEAGEADDKTVQRCDDRELAGKLGAEGGFVVGARGPGGALVVVVVVGGRKLDGVAKISAQRSASAGR